MSFLSFSTLFGGLRGKGQGLTGVGDKDLLQCDWFGDGEA